MNLTNKLYENGYEIYLDGILWITQFDKYAKPLDNTKSIKENCELQMQEIINSYNNPPKPYTQGQYDAVIASLITEGVL